MNNPFDRLAPFIQEYIYRNHWEELRDIQADAISAVFDLSSHILISSGTASGKTEAAFFPILTQLYNQPLDSFGVVYIGPLKALINDQFERIQALIDEAEIPLYAWHGDRSQSEKTKAMKHPQGILQITPEALEALLINHSGEVRHMFRNLQFIIIDEIHAFMGTDRGIQLQCQLNHLDRLTGKNIRRVGLSATIQNIEDAGQWLKAGSPLDVKIISSSARGRNLRLAFRHDEYPVDANDETIAAIQAEMYQYLYNQVKGRKCLVFTNSRMESEMTAVALREIALKNHEPEAFFVHHGSISAILRGETEAILRSSDEPATAIATKTLELGIDLGHLERVIQLGAPGSCSSFVQRLGRTGRRGTPAVMSFITKNTPEGSDTFDDLPWEMLQNIAIIQLYLEEKWVEPFAIKTCPYSVLVHQTLSCLMRKECTAKELAKYVLSLPAFQIVSPQDYFALLKHMIEDDLIEKTETGTLIPGLAGEKLAGNFHFYSVFSDQSGYRVIFHQRTLGEIDYLPEIDEVIVLAGKNWRVTETDEDKKSIYVVQSSGTIKKQWSGGMAEIHDKIFRKMQSILIETNEYPYLNDAAKDALRIARKTASNFDIQRCYTKINDKSFIIHPWIGTRKFITLLFILQSILKEDLQIQNLQSNNARTGIHVVSEIPAEAFFSLFQKKIIEINPDNLFPFVPTSGCDTYDRFVPEELLRKAYVFNHLDLKGLKELLLE